MMSIQISSHPYPKDWSEYRQLWNEAQLQKTLTSHPLHLDIELTSHCNLRCTMCWQSGAMTAPKGFMEFDLFKKIINDGVASGLCAVKLQSRGESTLHPKFFEFAKYAKVAGVMDLQVTTNGTNFDERSIDDLISSGLDLLIVSIDDQHDDSLLEVYGDNAPNITQSVQQIIEKREKSGSPTPKIRIQTIAFPNQTKVDRLAEIKSEYPDADHYMVNHLWNSDTDREAIENLSTDFNMLPCSYLWTRMAVLWDGVVTTCCYDYNASNELGNANLENVPQIWLGRKMMRLRERHLADERSSISVCNMCEQSIEPKENKKIFHQFLHDKSKA